MTDTTPSRAEQVLALCRGQGFALAGIAAARPTDYAAELRRWLEAGRHGDMAWMEDRIDVRCDPARLVPGARSIICVADRHADRRPDPSPPPGFGRIARYARGRDYHVLIKKRLHEVSDRLRERYPGETFRTCVDTAPVLEREHARRAGIGAVGKHTLIIEPGVGSYLLVGEIITTMALAPSAPAAPDPCGTCTRCIDACPTDAITPWAVNAAMCISYLTIEHRSAIDERRHEAIGDWIFGCDICQEVCPHNQPTERSADAAAHEAYAARRRGFDLLEVLGWDEAARREAFAASALKRAKLPMMKRNALIAAGNALATEELPALRERVEAIAADGREPELVRDTARAVLHHLGRR